MLSVSASTGTRGAVELDDGVSDGGRPAIVEVSIIVRVIKTLLVVGASPHSKPADSGAS